jgi:hypothetical protein
LTVVQAQGIEPGLLEEYTSLHYHRPFENGIALIWLTDSPDLFLVSAPKSSQGCVEFEGK